MFNRSRKKIMFLIMLSLLLLLAVTLSVIMLASFREIRKRDSEMLERYVETYILDEDSVLENQGETVADNPGESVLEDQGGSESEDQGKFVPENQGGSESGNQGESVPENQGVSVPENQGGSEPDNHEESETDNQEGSRPENQEESVRENQGVSVPENQGGSEPKNQEGSEPENQEGSRPVNQGVPMPENQDVLRPEDQGELRPGNQGIPVPENQGIPGPGPNQGNPPPDVRPDFQLSTFYSVAFSEDDTVLAVDNGAKGLYGEDELVEIARNLLEKGKKSGRLDNLSYLISSRTGYTLVAFIDNTVTDGSMKMLLRNVLIVGGTAIVMLYFISLFLSKQIIRPLEENDKRQKQFISDASHELKTPVAVISTNAEMLSRELGENEWLANIQYENERMGGLVKQLLDLSRAENAEVPMEQIDFSRLVTGEVLAFESFAFDKGKVLQSDIEDGIFLFGNQTQLTQLTSILLDNALRHSTGSAIELTLKRKGHSAVVSIVNDGDEIPAEKLEHLFDRFYRVDEARNSEEHHYGLGLSIAKAVAEKHGGSISVSCRDGKVRFMVSIPEKNK